MLLTLGPCEAHLWYLRTTLSDPSLLASYEKLLTPEEASRRARFVFARGRHEFLLTRALVRTTLSRYADVDPRDWRFGANAHGKPHIVLPVEAKPPKFSLSHTDGLIVCLVALAPEVGVDVENVERPGDTVEVADRFFSLREARALRALPPAAQRARFFDYWTLKESYIKARGLGISLPLGKFSFSLDEGPSLRISFDPPLTDEPGSWQFDRFRPTPAHFVATAIRRGGESPVHFVERWVVPLAA